MQLVGKILKVLAPYIFQLSMHLMGWLKWWLDKNPEVRTKLDDFIIKNIGPWLKEHAFEIMQKYGEYTAKRAAAEKARTKKAEQAVQSEQAEKKAEHDSADTSEGTGSTQTDDEPDLSEAASQTARAGYKKARQISGVAGKKAGRWLSDARKWLEDETGLNENDDSDEPDSEDKEITRLKRKLAEETQQETQDVTEEQKVPKPVVPKKPAEDEKDKSEQQIGTTDRLQKLLDEERKNRDLQR